jgi:hypothetical protein
MLAASAVSSSGSTADTQAELQGLVQLTESVGQAKVLGVVDGAGDQ